MSCPYCRMMMTGCKCGRYENGTFIQMDGYRCVNRGCSLHDELMTVEQINNATYVRLVAKIKNNRKRR